MDSRGARATRGLVGALVSTLIAGFSHTAAGAHAPSILALVVTFAFASMICVALAGRTLSPWRLGVAVALSQGLFHVLFGALGSGAVLVEAGAHSGTVHSPGVVASLGETATSADTAGMWAWHVVAAVATVLALRHGEVTLRRLSRLALLAIAAVLSRVPAVRLPARPRIRVLSGDRAPIARRLLSLSALRHRGPPLAV